MKRSLVIGGSVGSVIILMMISFSSVIASHANIQSINNEKETLGPMNNFRNNILDYPPGYFLRVLFQMFLSLFAWFFINIWANIVS